MNFAPVAASEREKWKDLDLKCCCPEKKMLSRQSQINLFQDKIKTI